MTRKEHFMALADHPWLGRSYKRLREEDVHWCLNWLDAHASDSKDAAALIITKLFLDNPAKPKAWKEMEELLICSNSAL
jgi:hypothetical protein